MGNSVQPNNSPLAEPGTSLAVPRAFWAVPRAFWAVPRGAPLIVLLVIVMVQCGLESAAVVPTAAADENAEATPRPIALQEPALDESSGLALSMRVTNRLWSHNDSGGKPRLYAFDLDGNKTGHCDLESIDAQDWEDMASFVDRSVSRLLVADCGDNQSKRRSIDLHLLDEPDPNRSTNTRQIETISVRYQDGPRDCEAVAVDAVRRQIVLIAKGRLPAAGIYLITLPDRQGESAGDKTEVIARRIGTLPIPMVTAMDIDPRSGDIWVINYLQAFRFSCQQRDEPIGTQLSRSPTSYPAPRLKQIEALAVGRSGVWVTSEGSPTKMDFIPVADSGQP